MKESGFREKLSRGLFLLSALVLEAAWVIALAVGAFKFYEWMR